MDKLHKAASEFAEAFQTSAGDIDAKLEALLDVLEEKDDESVADRICNLIDTAFKSGDKNLYPECIREPDDELDIDKE